MVREAFIQELPVLLKLPDNPYPVLERVAVSAGKTPYVRFDLNDYSVPHTHVRRTLTILAGIERVRIVDGERVLADHPRSYGKGEQFEDPAHIQALVEQKRAARRHRATDHLTRAAPASQCRASGSGTPSRRAPATAARQHDPARSCAGPRCCCHPARARYLRSTERPLQ